MAQTLHTKKVKAQNPSDLRRKSKMPDNENQVFSIFEEMEVRSVTLISMWLRNSRRLPNCKLNIGAAHEESKEIELRTEQATST